MEGGCYEVSRKGGIHKIKVVQLLLPQLSLLWGFCRGRAHLYGGALSNMSRVGGRRSGVNAPFVREGASRALRDTCFPGTSAENGMTAIFKCGRRRRRRRPKREEERREGTVRNCGSRSEAEKEEKEEEEKSCAHSRSWPSLRLSVGGATQERGISAVCGLRLNFEHFCRACDMK